MSTSTTRRIQLGSTQKPTLWPRKLRPCPICDKDLECLEVFNGLTTSYRVRCGDPDCSFYTIRDLHPDVWNREKKTGLLSESGDKNLYPPRLSWVLGEYRSEHQTYPALVADMPLAHYTILRHPEKQGFYLRKIKELHISCLASSVPNLRTALVSETDDLGKQVRACTVHWKATLDLFNVLSIENYRRSKEMTKLCSEFAPTESITEIK